MILITHFASNVDELFSHLALFDLHLFPHASDSFHHGGLLGKTLSPHMAVPALQVLDLSLKTTRNLLRDLSKLAL
jgi:hypothetical protein